MAEPAPPVRCAGYALTARRPAPSTTVEHWSAAGPEGLAEVYVGPPSLLARAGSLPVWGPFPDLRTGRLADGRSFVVVLGTLSFDLEELAQRLSPGAAVAFAWHVASALAEVHERGGAHGALHPSFVGLDARGRLTLRPAFAASLPSEPDPKASAQATDCLQLDGLLEVLDLDRLDEPGLALLRSGLSKDRARFRIHPGRSARQALSALLSRHADWEASLIESLGAEWRFSNAPRMPPRPTPSPEIAPVRVPVVGAPAGPGRVLSVAVGEGPARAPDAAPLSVNVAAAAPRPGRPAAPVGLRVTAIPAGAAELPPRAPAPMLLAVALPGEQGAEVPELAVAPASSVAPRVAEPAAAPPAVAAGGPAGSPATLVVPVVDVAPVAPSEASAERGDPAAGRGPDPSVPAAPSGPAAPAAADLPEPGLALASTFDAPIDPVEATELAPAPSAESISSLLEKNLAKANLDDGSPAVRPRAALAVAAVADDAAPVDAAPDASAADASAADDAAADDAAPDDAAPHAEADDVVEVAFDEGPPAPPAARPAQPHERAEVLADEDDDDPPTNHDGRPLGFGSFGAAVDFDDDDVDERGLLNALSLGLSADELGPEPTAPSGGFVPAVAPAVSVPGASPIPALQMGRSNLEPAPSAAPPPPAAVAPPQTPPLGPSSPDGPRWEGAGGVTGAAGREAELGAGKWTEPARSPAEVQAGLSSGPTREIEPVDDGRGSKVFLGIGLVAGLGLVLWWALAG